jgi:hypothetical protein
VEDLSKPETCPEHCFWAWRHENIRLGWPAGEDLEVLELWYLRVAIGPALQRINPKGDKYKNDKFCIKIKENTGSIPGLYEINELLYIGTWLVIPHMNDIRENLFRLAHDVLGHFGSDKSYAMLRDDYYWPNMRRDLEKAYILGYKDYQGNKSSTHKPQGLLHPLPTPDNCGDSVAIDFIVVYDTESHILTDS